MTSELDFPYCSYARTKCPALFYGRCQIRPLNEVAEGNQSAFGKETEGYIVIERLLNELARRWCELESYLERPIDDKPLTAQEISGIQRDKSFK